MANRKPTPGKNLVFNTIVVKPNTRSALDVGQWRNALKAADKGKREKLYDLYEDVLLDNVLSSAIDDRILAITNAELTFTKNEKNVPEMDTLIDTPAFEKMLKEIMNAIFWGKSVIELDFPEQGLGVYSIPRKHIRPELGIIVKNPSDEFGIPYRNEDFFIEVGEDKDLGKLLKVAPIAIYKRGGFGDWSQFVELFGMPQRIGKYNSHDDEARKTLEDALEKAGSASWLVIPKDTDVETKESTSFSNALMHEKFKNACNEEMLISIVGQTMTTLNGSSKSQSETHKKVEESINKADRRFVQRILNTELLPRLEKRGYPVAGGFFFFPDEGENLTVAERLDVHVRFVKDLGLPIDEDWLYETYSVPKPKGGAKPKAEEKPDTKKDEENQKFWERVFSFFLKAPAEMGASNLNVCPDCGGNHPTHFNLADLPSHNSEGLIKRIANGESTTFDIELFNFTSGALLKALSKGFTAKKHLSPGISYGFEPDALKTAMEMNIFRFSAGKTLAEVSELNRLFRESESLNQFKEKAEQLTSVFNKNWLETEYNTAYLTAESSAAFYRLKEQSEIFPYWQYTTVQDGMVREEHAALHGVILPANDPRWKKIWPPNGWNCRCRIVPLTRADVEGYDVDANRAKVDNYFKSPEWKRNANQGFDVNKALTGEVFKKNQQYINKLEGNSDKKLEALFAENWKLDEIENRLAAATNNLKPYTGTADEFFVKNSVNGELVFTDYLNREIKLSKKNFERHTSGKRTERVQYLDELSSIMSKPDEVWFNNINNEWNNFIFIRYYKDNAMAVIAEIGEGKVYQVNTWFRIAVESEVKRKTANPKFMYRRGLLISNRK